MTAMTPVDRIAEVLGNGGFKRIPTPLEIAGMKFELPAAFLGEPPSPDLVLIADCAVDTEQRILRKVDGIARAMDVMRSKRPLTVVLAGPRPTSSTMDLLSRVCRVLPVGPISEIDSEMALQNWLAVLLPLKLPEVSASIADPLTELSAHLEGLPPEITSLIATARLGTDAVQSRLHELIIEPLADQDLDYEQ